MRKYLLDYFVSKKRSNLILLLFNILVILAGFLFYKYRPGPLVNGALVPLLSIALIQLIISIIRLLRNQKLLENLSLSLDEQQPTFFVNEIKRMEGIEKDFDRNTNVFLLVFLLGFIFLMMGAFGNWGLFVCGTGAGLCLQAAMLLCMELFRRFQAESYLHQLKRNKRNS